MTKPFTVEDIRDDEHEANYESFDHPMQFTGLKTQTNQEIYEEDIVLIEDYHRDGKMFDKVIGRVFEQAACFYVCGIDNGAIGELGEVYLFATVVGNCHENPELLHYERSRTNQNINTTMADYEAVPEGGIKEAGAEQPVTPAAAPAEEVKNDILAPAPEAATEPEDKPEGDEAPAKEEPAEEPEEE
jgi:hypothetical protein